MSRLLNVGCGNVFHPDWVNLDAAPSAPEVTAHDLRRGIPYADESFDAVYGSHVLEHLEPCAAARLLRECLRILKPEGIARLVVPDLEAIAGLYLRSLEGALAGDAQARQRYDWIMLELYDQAVRTVPGGAMGAHLRGTMDGKQAEFVASRIGDEALTPVPYNRRAVSRLAKAVSLLRRSAAGAGAFFFLGTEAAKRCAKACSGAAAKCTNGCTIASPCGARSRAPDSPTRAYAPSTKVGSPASPATGSKPGTAAHANRTLCTSKRKSAGAPEAAQTNAPILHALRS